MPSLQPAASRKGMRWTISRVVSGIHNSHYICVRKKKIYSLIVLSVTLPQHFWLRCSHCVFLCLLTFVWMTEYFILSICSIFHETTREGVKMKAATSRAEFSFYSQPESSTRVIPDSLSIQSFWSQQMRCNNMRKLIWSKVDGPPGGRKQRGVKEEEVEQWRNTAEEGFDLKKRSDVLLSC